MPNNRIAAINDSSDLRQLFKEVLGGDAGYDVVTFDRNTVSVEEIATFGPALIIIDPLPVEHSTRPAFALLHEVGRNEHLRQVPLLICSDRQLIAEHRDGLEVFSHAYFLSKPFALEQLEGIVGALMQGREPRNAGLPEK